jgi:endonuclease/exonuclease/phosphatase family metal-dependent hydrolase
MSIVRTARRAFLVASLVALAIASHPQDAAADATLRVMTFNIRYATAPDGENSWANRKDLLLDVIRKFGPDLLGTQEVLASQADFLSRELDGYTLVGVGRDDGKRKGEFSSLMYRTARFEARDSGTFWLSESPEVAGSKSWDSSLPRIATWVRLRDKESKAELLFLNTHWDHRGKQARIEAGKIIRQWITDHADKLPVVVTGDLNVNEDHEGILALVAEDAKPRLLDVYRAVHPKSRADEATFHAFNGERRGKRIDFIFASPQLAPTEATIVRTAKDGRDPSDHYPVTAVLSWPSKPAK